MLAVMPDLNEALAWTGFRVDDVYGARVGIVEDIYVDHDSDTPCWMLVKMGRFSDAHALLPLNDAVPAQATCGCRTRRT